MHHISMATETLKMTVHGMTCGNCARSVERKLSSTPGVTKATVDLLNQNATVDYEIRRGQARSARRRRATTRLRSPRMKTSAPERVDLPVSGMTCAACARAIERTLAVAPGVDRARVNLATNTATVEYDPTVTGVRDFVGAIEDLGLRRPREGSPVTTTPHRAIAAASLSPPSSRCPSSSSA